MSAKQFTYIPQPECLSQVREDVNACLEDAGWEERRMDVSLALGEVLQNIIRYGFEGVRLQTKIVVIFNADPSV
ncbi:MAG: ATP-binding protein [Pseudomonadota bacterium]|nr:ATP-binding protein [Pseudomonadota bacterium]